jgi:hypothetical protein
MSDYNGMSIRKLKEKKNKLERQYGMLKKEINRRKSIFDPTTYDLPDLKGLTKRDDETQEEFEQRQNKRLKQTVEDNLYILQDGERTPIKLTGPYLKACSDVFYNRTQKAIFWGPRGGGKSVVASVIIYLKMIYDQMSFINMANSQDQAKVVYDYTRGFWHCVDGIADNLLVKEPLQKKTLLRGNVKLKCVTASQSQTRGKHPPGLVIDEAATEDKNKEEVFRAMMQGPISEPNHCIFIMSTFHVAEGFFQEIWDNAEQKGFNRYRADIFDSMSECNKGLEHATEDDPLAKENYCMTDCPLTEKDPVYDYKGKKVDEEIIGCQGKARHTDGHLSFDQVKSLKDQNEGTDVYYVEILCQRPGKKDLVFPPEYIDGDNGCLIDIDDYFNRNNIQLNSSNRKIVGLDWGFDDELAMVLAQRIEDYVVVTDMAMESGVIIDYVKNKIDEWREKYGGVIPIYGDNSNKGQNYELHTKHNIPTASVPFNKYKTNMIRNLNRYLVKERILISKELSDLVNQLKKFKRDSAGKVKSEDDHSVDALMLAMFFFYFSNEFPFDPSDDDEVIMTGTETSNDYDTEVDDEDISITTF